MPDGRKRIARVLATLAITALGGSALAASAAFAEPDVADVRAEVDQLYHQAEVASERYNEAREELHRAQGRLSSLRGELKRQKGKLKGIRRQVVSAVLAQSQGQVFSSATQAALSESPDAFLQRLVIISQYNGQLSEMKADFATQAGQLQVRQKVAERELSRIAETEQELAVHKAEINEKVSEATDLLDRLEAKAAARAAERATRALEERRDDAATPAPSSPSPTPSVPESPTPTSPSPTSSVSGRAGAAVDYAFAQVGDAYVYGASGPASFDCSGLTMMAWAQAGVSLPHSSSQQMSYGTSVSFSDLQPGDLVFYYSPVSHVGIYVGNGRMVHAANPSDGVVTAPVSSMPFSGAVRPG